MNTEQYKSSLGISKSVYHNGNDEWGILVDLTYVYLCQLEDLIDYYKHQAGSLPCKLSLAAGREVKAETNDSRGPGDTDKKAHSKYSAKRRKRNIDMEEILIVNRELQKVYLTSISSPSLELRYYYCTVQTVQYIYIIIVLYKLYNISIANEKTEEKRKFF